MAYLAFFAISDLKVSKNSESAFHELSCVMPIFGISPFYRLIMRLKDEKNAKTLHPFRVTNFLTVDQMFKCYIPFERGRRVDSKSNRVFPLTSQWSLLWSLVIWNSCQIETVTSHQFLVLFQILTHVTDHISRSFRLSSQSWAYSICSSYAAIWK